MAGLNLSGKKFGRLTVIKDTGKRQNGKEKIWLCKCECGNIKEVMTSNLTGNKIRSCGCLRKEKSGNRGKITIKKAFNSVGYVDGTSISHIKESKTRKNNTSGHTGVYWDNARQKWVAHLTINYKKKTLGYYDKLEDAIKARIDGEEKYFKPILQKYKEDK